MYLNCTVLLKLGKVTSEIDYKSGVQQGDNMALILFLYVMQAAIETLQHGTRSHRIKMTKSQLGMLKYFFSCKNVKLPMKYWIYIAAPQIPFSGDLNPGTYQMLTATNIAQFNNLQ